MIEGAVSPDERHVQVYLKSISERNPYLQRGFDTVKEYLDGLGGEPWKGIFLIFGNFERDFFYSDELIRQIGMQKAAQQYAGSGCAYPGVWNMEEIEAAAMSQQEDMKRGYGNLLRKFNGDWAKAFQEIEKSCGVPLLWLDSHLGDLYERMARPKEGDPDGAIVFNMEGYLYGTQMFVNKPDMDAVPRETIKRIAEIKNMYNDRGTKTTAAAFASLNGLPSVVGNQDARTVIGFWKGFIPDELVYDSR